MLSTRELVAGPVGSDEERGVPKPQPQRPVVANPSTPGVQKPPNRPGGRDAPPAPEKRGSVLLALKLADAYKTLAQPAPAPPPGEKPSVLAQIRRADALRTLHVHARGARRPRRTSERRGPSRERRPTTRRRSARTVAASSGDPPQSDGDDDPPPRRPPLTADQRQWLKAEVDRRRRKRLRRESRIDRLLFASEATP
jgi:hypothetical protein